MERMATPKEFDEALEAVDWPASKAAITNRAADKGGLNAEVNYVLGEIEDQTYETRAELDAEISRVYAITGGLDHGGPAAAAGATPRDKDRIEAAADPRKGEKSEA